MPALLFPSANVLRLVLASGVVPPGVVRAPARGMLDPAGRVWLEPATHPARETLAALARLGVAPVATAASIAHPVGSWAELLPLRRCAGPPGQTVLFVVPDAQLAAFHAELNRLGATATGLRLLTDDRVGRAWLACHSPPGWVRSRCLEPDSPVESFAEQAPGVWVRDGWEHPLPEHLSFPEGRLLLLRPPGAVAVEAGPVPTPGPEEFTLTDRSLAGGPHPAAPLISVPLVLRTVPDTPREVVWVFSGHVADQFWDFCRSANERLLRMYEVATARVGGAPRVIVRPAPGNRIPPMLPLEADGYYPDPRVAGLFVPTRRVIRPTVRVRELARLLGLRLGRVTWLEAVPGRGVVAVSVPAAVFRPAASLLEYTVPPYLPLVIDQPANDPFAFERVALVVPAEPDPSGYEVDEPGVIAGLSSDHPLPAGHQDRSGWLVRSLERILGKFRRTGGGVVDRTEVMPAEPAPPASLPGHAKAPGSTLPRIVRKLSSTAALLHGDDRTARRHELESRLLDLFPRLDAGHRAAGWADLAAVYGATGNTGDAAVCWMNAVWDADPVPPQWAEQWLLAECRAANDTAADLDLERWLSQPGRAGAARVVAARTVCAALPSEPPAELIAALPRVLTFLDQHLDDLPARAAWLARRAATHLSAGDALGLARWRDRIIARLRDKGPGLDLDEPSFLRFHGTASPDRFQTAREWLGRARRPVLEWVGRLASAGRLQWAGLDPETDCTAAYTQLMMAWGLGCLGERTRARDWTVRARKVLGRAAGSGVDPAVHALLGDAFQHRIRDVQEGRPSKPGLTPELAARFDQLPAFSRYAVDRLRAHSRILEPLGRTHAYRGLDVREVRGSDRLGERLQLLSEHSDPVHIADEARQLLRLCDTDLSPAVVPRVVLSLLDLAPDLPPPLIRDLLGRVVPAADGLGSWLRAGRWTDAERGERLTRYLARLVGATLATAAWFNELPAVRPVVDHLLRRVGSDFALRAAVGRSAGSLFRSLRKLGHRAESETLLHLIDPDRGDWPAAAPLPPARLGLAVGWFAAGDEDAGNRILDAARTRLFVARIPDDRDRTELAIAYAEALGVAPPRIALGRLEEIFQLLDRVTTTGSTNRYYTLKPLQLVDAVVRSVVTDDFALGPLVRGWMDDDEFLIRRRIHRDMAAVLRAEGID